MEMEDDPRDYSTTESLLPLRVIRWIVFGFTQTGRQLEC